MPHKIRVQGKDVDEAINKGLKKLGLRHRDQVEVNVLETARKGFLGIGARMATVEIRQKRWSGRERKPPWGPLAQSTTSGATEGRTGTHPQGQ